jgi:hypothetical protein
MSDEVPRIAIGTAQLVTRDIGGGRRAIDALVLVRPSAT